MAVDGIALCVDDVAQAVHRLTDNVENASECSFAYRHSDWTTGINRFHAAHHAVRGQHGNRTHPALAQMLLDFGDHIDWSGNLETLRHDAQSLIDRRQMLCLEFHVNNWSDDLHDVTEGGDVCARSVRRNHTDR